MKKEYSKPGIIIEDFALVQNVAGNCGNTQKKYTYADKYHCAWDTGSSFGTVFTVETICQNVLGENEKYEAECYNNPGGMYTIFNS